MRAHKPKRIPNKCILWHFNMYTECDCSLWEFTFSSDIDVGHLCTIKFFTVLCMSVRHSPIHVYVSIHTNIHNTWFYSKWAAIDKCTTLNVYVLRRKKNKSGEWFLFWMLLFTFQQSQFINSECKNCVWIWFYDSFLNSHLSNSND